MLVFGFWNNGAASWSKLWYVFLVILYNELNISSDDRLTSTNMLATINVPPYIRINPKLSSSVAISNISTSHNHVFIIGTHCQKWENTMIANCKTFGTRVAYIIFSSIDDESDEMCFWLISCMIHSDVSMRWLAVDTVQYAIMHNTFESYMMRRVVDSVPYYYINIRYNVIRLVISYCISFESKLVFTYVTIFVLSNDIGMFLKKCTKKRKTCS